METRFQGTELWLRIYPDDVHVNSFEPELTPDESSARTGFLARAQSGRAGRAGAFTVLAQQYGAERAAWIASPNAQAGTKTSQWTQAPYTNVLPERWIVMGLSGERCRTGPGDRLAYPPIAGSWPRPQRPRSFRR